MLNVYWRICAQDLVQEKLKAKAYKRTETHGTICIVRGNNGTVHSVLKVIKCYICKVNDSHLVKDVTDVKQYTGNVNISGTL